MATNTPFGQRLGLVLEGGAMRGIYTAGVLDVFLEAGIMPDVVVGVSAGALHGCSYVAGQKGRSIRYYRKYRSDKHFMGLYSLLTSGETESDASTRTADSAKIIYTANLLLKKPPLIFMSP